MNYCECPIDDIIIHKEKPISSFLLDRMTYEKEQPSYVSASYRREGIEILPEKSAYFMNVSQINTLIKYQLTKPLSIVIEYDEQYFLSRSVDFPIYATGEDIIEAITNMKHMIEELYEELLEDDNFSDEWLNYKKLLENIVKK